MLYDKMNLEENYNDETDEEDFVPTLDFVKKLAAGYVSQDKKEGRNASKNIKAEEILELLRENKRCFICHIRFTDSVRPTLDMIDNGKAHGKENVKVSCKGCNCAKGNRDVEGFKLRVQMNLFAKKNNLPMTLNDERTYHILREGITGGLANVGHRFNFAGITKINKYKIVDGKVLSIDTEHVMTHGCGADYSSLYPSVCSSNTNQFIPYTGHKMWMPGYQTRRMEATNEVSEKAATQEEMLSIILDVRRFECEDEEVIGRLPWFFAVVRGHIAEERLNDYINFPPILKKLEVETTRENIGGYMYDFLEENRLPREKKEMKLTQFLSTHGKFMSFGMYELWGLIDDCHFIVDKVQTLILFTKHDKIGTFVNDVFQRRIDAKSKGENAMWKNILNS
jgi:hypothetical protein